MNSHLQGIRKWVNAKSRRGSILAITFLMCMLAAMASVWMIKTMQDHQRINVFRRNVNRAYFAAQAGVEQVRHWGNFPDDYDGLGTAGLFYRDPLTGTFPQLTAMLAGGQEFTIPEDKLGRLRSKHGYRVARINELTLIGPDPAGGDQVVCMFKIRSQGADHGHKREILAYIEPAPLATATDVQLPAALITFGTAGFSGSGSIHWGEGWSKNNFEVLPKSQCDNLNLTDAAYDQWVKMRTEASLLFGPTWKTSGPNPHKIDVYDVASATANYDPAKELDSGGVAVTHGKYEGAFEMNIPVGQLVWPDFASQYQAFKDQAIAHGRYYGTDAAGNVYRDGIEDAEHLVDFNTEFGQADRVNSPYDLVFIDTADGNPPGVGNIATIKNSGTGVGMKGVFYINANFEQAGAGNPAALNAKKPDGTMELLPKVYLDGVIYTAGWMDLGGNPVIYGCAVSEGGYKSGGTPEVYYNHLLKEGLEMPKGNIGSTFDIILEKNYGAN